jgi:hypothetical protein
LLGGYGAIYTLLFINSNLKMKKIRQELFETNSSSTHSVSIAYGSDAELTDLPRLNKDGTINIESGEFGWEIETYNNVWNKLSYAATYALNFNYQWEKEESNKFDYNNKYLLLLTNVIKEYTGATEVIYDENTNEFPKHGYIDHQSIDEAASIFESKDSLKNFLFNPSSYFKTDNDNY